MPNTDTLNIIITRPNNRATTLVDTINALSTNKLLVKAHHEPLIKITSYHDQAFFKLLSSSAKNFSNTSLNFDGVIFISGNAVDWARHSLESSLWQIIINKPLFAIGEQTAAVLQSEINRAKPNQLKLHQAVRYPLKMNSEGLLDLPELKQVQGQQWLIVKGLGGRERLKTGLETAGATVLELSVYQRQLPSLTAQKRILQQQNSQPLWLISSVHALTNLCQILNRHVQQCRIIVSSDRIAEQASQLGFKIEAQAKDASDQQLVYCLADYIDKQVQVT